MYSPHIFENGRNGLNWLPSKTDRDVARTKLPYLAKDRFTHFRMDDRIAVHHTFVRRPSYYAVFNAGEMIAEIQRYGLGLLWHPKMGSVLQTQSREHGPWGTASVDGEIYEASSFDAKIAVDSNVFDPTPGQHNLSDSEVIFEYALGVVGQKTVRFDEAEIAVTVAYEGRFIEHLPLLVQAGDELTSENGQIRLQRSGSVMVISFDSRVDIDIKPTDMAHGPFELKRVEVSAQDHVQYHIVFE